MELGRPKGELSYAYHSSQFTHSSQKKFSLQQEEGRFSSCLEIIQPMRNCYNPEISSSELLNKQPLPPSTFPLFFYKRILLLLVSKLWDSLVAQTVKSLPAMGREDPLEKEMATHSSILAWKIPWTEEPGGLPSMGSQSLTQLRNFTFHLWSSPMVCCSFRGAKGNSCGIPK